MTRPNEPGPLDPALSRWIDGACDADEARRVEARLASDPALAAEVDRLRAAMDVFREDAAAAAPDRLGERVLAAVARGDDESDRFHALARRYAAAAAVLLAVGVGGTVWTHGTIPAAGTAAPPTIAELEESHMDGERYLDLDSQPVEGR